MRVSAKTVKGEMNPVDTVADNDGKWGTSQEMVSMAIAKIGTTPPFFVERGAKISGETYIARLAHNFFPAMSAIATKKKTNWTHFPSNRTGLLAMGSGRLSAPSKRIQAAPSHFRGRPEARM